VILAPGEKVFEALLAIAGAVIILTGHWATTDDIIADLIAGLLMLAFGVVVLLSFNANCRPGPSRSQTPSYSDSASSSATPPGRRSPTSISRRSRDGAPAVRKAPVTLAELRLLRCVHAMASV
jgi:hypothetical protein